MAATRGRRLRAGWLVTAAASAVLLVAAASAWACTNHTGSTWICSSTGLCGSSSRITSAATGSTVYGEAGGLDGNVTFDVKAAVGSDPTSNACHTGSTWYTATSSGSTGGIGGWNSQSFSLSGVAANTYVFCAVPQTGSLYSAHDVFTVTAN